MTNRPAPPRSRSRLLSLVAVLAVLGAPAAVLRGLCVGNSCNEQTSAASEVPFCSLAAEQRDLMEAGFEGELHRSPDLVGVTPTDVVVTGGSAFSRGQPQPAWPATDSTAARVPLLFWGTGVDAEASIPAGTGLDDVAPTIAEMISFKRPHPTVRSGRPIDGVPSGNTPRVVVEIALKDVGSDDIEDDETSWPVLHRLLAGGAGTFDAVTGSIPTDPAAILTTIGTGGLPHQHGMVGTLVRNGAGRVVRAWGPGSPVHIIATLPDDLDEELDQKPLIGLVQSDPSDRGLVGGDWYVATDEDEIVTETAQPATAVEEFLDRGFGRDSVPDILAVALAGDADFMDEQVGRIARLVERRASEAALVVTATGGHPATRDFSASAVQRELERAVPGAADAVEAMAPGGIFLDQQALGGNITEDDVLKALRALEGADGRPLLADAFPAIAVSFARYC